MRLRTKTLRPGTRLYHGTSGDFDERHERFHAPMWVTDKPRAARWFVSWHGEPEPLPYGKKLSDRARIIEFRAVRPLRLLLIADREAMDEIIEMSMSGGDTDSTAEWVLDQGYDGWFIPNNYPDEMAADIMLRDETGLQIIDTQPITDSYGMDNDVDVILQRIQAEEAQPPHKQNAARIGALKRQYKEMTKRLESQGIQCAADRLLPHLTD